MQSSDRLHEQIMSEYRNNMWERVGALVADIVRHSESLGKLASQVAA